MDETSETQNRSLSTLRSAWISVRKFSVEIAPILAVVVAVLWGSMTFIDHRVKSYTNNEEFIRQVAQNVRPSLIFNGEGSILADQGAQRYVDEHIKITMTPFTGIPPGGVIRPNRCELKYPTGSEVFPSKIVISPKSNSPTLHSSRHWMGTNFLYRHIAERGTSGYTTWMQRFT